MTDLAYMPPTLITTMIEMMFPKVPWCLSYRLVRLHGLTPELKGFLWRMVHCLLLTRDRLHRLHKTDTDSCLHCNEDDSITHFISCSFSSKVTDQLILCLQSYIPRITAENIETVTSMELPLVWLTVTTLKYVWEEKAVGRVARLGMVHAELLARVGIFRRIRR